MYESFFVDCSIDTGFDSRGCSIFSYKEKEERGIFLFLRLFRLRYERLLPQEIKGVRGWGICMKTTGTSFLLPFRDSIKPSIIKKGGITK